MNTIAFDNYYDSIKKIETIFELVKKGRYEDAIDLLNIIIKDNLQFVNYKDQYGNSLLNLAINRNQLRLVETLLNNGAIVDIVDNDGLHILYYPVRFGYQSMTELIVNYVTNNVSIDIMNAEDKNGMTIILYAVRFKNYVAFGYFLNQNINLNYLTKKKIAVIHYLIIKKENTLLELLLKKPVDVNLIGIDGEGPLHLACNFKDTNAMEQLIKHGAKLNLPTENYLLLPIHYLIHNGMTEWIIRFIDLGTSLIHQDFQGNTVIHHCIYNSNFDVLDYIFKFPVNKTKNYDWTGLNQQKPNQSNQVIDPSLTNIDGLTITHLLLYYYSDRMDPYLDKIIPKSNLNLQDNKGNTIIHLISDTNLWIKFADYFRNKKINLYIKNRDNEIPLDYLKGTPDEISLLKNQIFHIVADGYYAYLKRHPNSWLNKWESDCSLGITTEEECKRTILNEISNGRSMPIKKNAINIKLSYDIVVFNTFVSNMLDMVAGLALMAKKYSNVGVLFIENPVMDNNLREYYKSIGIENGENKLNYQIDIIWIFQKLFVPAYFADLIVKYSKEKDWIIIPLTITLENESHSNFLLFDCKRKIIERFEPYGSTYPPEFNYNPRLLDKLLERYINSLEKIGKVKYLTPSDYEPIIGFQIYGNYEKIYNTNIGDPEGFCLLWCFWFCEYKIQHPKINSSKLIKYLLSEIRMNHLYFRSVIRNYSKQITEYRDAVLNKYSFNVNDYINGKIDKETMIKIYDYFFKI